MTGVVVRYVQQLKRFSSNARYYLLSEIMFGLADSIYMLIFNFFVVSQGYPRSFLGELQALPSLIALFGAIPAGVLVDRIGRKSALLLSGLGWTVAALGIVVAPGAWWLRLSTIVFGLSGSLWMVSSAPFMMENSTAEERNALFSAHFGLTTLVGFFGTLVGGYLPTLFGNFLGVPIESAIAYGATLGVTVALSAIAVIPVFLIKEQNEPPEVEIEEKPRQSVSLLQPWRNLTDPGLALRIFLPNVIISLGAAILIPYMNLFFKETFVVPDKVLGAVFSVSAVITGVATLASPVLADRWGRIRALVFTQLVSIPFLLTIGFAPVFWLAAIGFWGRAALMNMGSPLYDAFAMEQFEAKERATISGLMGMSWNIGWTIGPFVSGYMQQNPNVGWTPIFVITCSFYVVAAILIKLFFQRLDDQQRRAAFLKKVGVVDVTAGAAQ